MIQVNLLPDLKREYIKTQQTKHLVVVGAVFASLVAVSLLTLMFLYVQIVQPRHRSNVQHDIYASLQELKSKKDGVKIVTVQGVLEQIPQLQDKKLISSAFFGYLTSFTPKAVSYSDVKLDLATNTMSLTGQAGTLEQTNELANNLKSATFTYTQKESSQSLQPFSRVVFTSLGKSDQSTNGAKPVSFQLSATFNPVMFSESIKDARIMVNASSEQLLLPTEQPFSTTTSTPTGGQ